MATKLYPTWSQCRDAEMAWQGYMGVMPRVGFYFLAVKASWLRSELVAEVRTCTFFEVLLPISNCEVNPGRGPSHPFFEGKIIKWYLIAGNRVIISATHWGRTRDLPRTEPSPCMPLPFRVCLKNSTPSVPLFLPKEEGDNYIAGGHPQTPAKGAVAPLDSRRSRRPPNPIIRVSRGTRPRNDNRKTWGLSPESVRRGYNCCMS